MSYSDCVDIACCAMLKNHTEGEAAKVRIALNEKRFLFMQNIAPITMAFIEPLTPPDVMKDMTGNLTDYMVKQFTDAISNLLFNEVTTNALSTF